MAGMASRGGTAAGIRSGRGFLLMLGVIAGCAFLLRLGVWAELGAVNGGRNSVYAPSVLTDLATYMKLGREMAAGEYTGPFYYQPFYYAVFLPGCYLLSGGSIGFVIFGLKISFPVSTWVNLSSSPVMFNNRSLFSFMLLARDCCSSFKLPIR